MSEKSEIKSVIWMGNSLRQVKSFPDFVRREIGSSLYDAQCGDKPYDAKPFKGVGSGVFEIVTRFDSDTSSNSLCRTNRRLYLCSSCFSKKITQRN